MAECKAPLQLTDEHNYFLSVVLFIYQTVFLLALATTSRAPKKLLQQEEVQHKLVHLMRNCHIYTSTD